MRKSLFIAALAATALVPPAALASDLLADPVFVGGTGRPALIEPAVTEPAAPSSDEASVRAAEGLDLIPFEDASDRMELSGEDDRATFHFSLRPADIARGGKLQLAFKNAVSVLPDNGTLSVEVNGRDVGTLPIASPFDFIPQQLPVDGRFLRPGRNEVTLRARQHHRVDCSMEATYELWTKFDPHLSGFQPRATKGFQTVEDLAQVGRMENGQTDIRLILPQTATADMINDALPLIEAIALYLNRDDVIVTIAATPGDGPGIDIFAGNDNTSNQTADGVKILNEAPYGLSVANASTPERARVILKGTSRQEMNSALLAAVRGPLAEGLKDGAFANRPGLVFGKAGERFTLKDAGFHSADFSGRLMRTRFDLVMPADFYPADYATLDVRLNAATAPGLESGAQLLFRVNDRIVNSFPFRDTDGETFSGKLIELPLRAFRPGVNRVELLAELPRASDAACLPDRGKETPRFIMLDTTEFSVPSLARVTRLPDLAAFAGQAYPYAGRQPFKVHVASPDSAMVSSALTLVTRLAQTARSPLKGEISFDPVPSEANGNAIVIATRQDTAFLEGRGPSLAAVETKTKTAELASFKVDDNAADLIRTDVIRTAAINALPADPAAEHVDADQLLESFQRSTQDHTNATSLTNRVKALFGIAGDRFGKWLNYETADGIVTLPDGDSLVTISQSLDQSGRAVVTTLVADNSADLISGVNRLAQPAIWEGLDGGAAVIEAKTMRLVTFAARDRAMLDVTDNSPGNYRRIAAAWFSDNFRFYVLVVLALAGFFAWWLSRTVPARGVRTDQ